MLTYPTIGQGLKLVVISLMGYATFSLQSWIPWCILELMPPLTFPPETTFNSMKWKSSLSSSDRTFFRDDPLIGSGENKEGMAADLVSNALLSGMTVKQVRKLLGLADLEVAQDQGKAGFRKTLQQPYLMIYECNIYYRYNYGHLATRSTQLLVFLDRDKVACTRLLVGVKYPPQLYDIY